MDIRHLEYFVEVARQKSFTKAAALLHVTQPTISKTIRLLEDELDVILFTRSSRNVVVTDAGHAVLRQAEKILRSVNDLSHELHDVKSLKKGSLRIGLPPITSSTIVPRLVGEFHLAYPMISIRLLEVGSKTVIQEVENGNLDIGVICSAPPEGQFGVIPLIKDPLQVVLSPTHPLADRSAIRFMDLRNEYFVLYPQDFSLHDKIIDRCNRAGFSPNIICESSQRTVMLELAAAGLGIAFLPKHICSQLDPQRFRTLPIADETIHVELSIIWDQTGYQSFAAQEWLKFTQKALRNTSNPFASSPAQSRSLPPL